MPIKLRARGALVPLRDRVVRSTGAAVTVCLALGIALLCSAEAPAGTSSTTGVRLVTTISGSGARVISRSLPAGPLVIKATNNGSSNFAVWLRGPAGKELLFNEIGPYAGVAVSQNRSGRHRFQVEAAGAWQLRVLAPTKTNVRPLVGSYKGKGSFAIPVRASSGELVVSARNGGDSNFVVYLVGFGNLTGRELVFNEIGPYRGETIVDVPSGNMVLWVQAEGAWTLRFSR